jgi:hypothetical protein
VQPPHAGYERGAEVTSLIGADSETCPIRHKATAPRPICFSGSDGTLVGNGDPEFWDWVEHVLRGESTWHNACFDLSVIATHAPSPHFTTLICDGLEEGRIHCTKVREKLLVLGTHGNLRMRPLPNGQWLPIAYALNDLSRRYLKKDRSDQKGEMPAHSWDPDLDEADQDPRGDAWRFNYDALDGWKAVEYPAEARAYAVEDAYDTREIFLLFQPIVEALHVGVEFYLYLVSSRGIAIDLKEVQRLREWVAQDLSDEALPLLVASGVMRPSQPARPHAGGHKQHVEGCKRKGCLCPAIMVAPEKSSIDTKQLHGLIESVCRSHNLPVVRTETQNHAADCPYKKQVVHGKCGCPYRVSAAKAVIEELAPYNETLGQYQTRQSLIVVQDREIPRMSASPVHPHYDGVKESFRTSCSATKLYPSGNVQNVDPRARGCYVPSKAVLEELDEVTKLLQGEDWEDYLGLVPQVLCSVDYGAMELVTLAQAIYTLFGSSTLRDQLNAGIDPHAYLGAQIQFAIRSDFRAHVQALGDTSKDGIYKAFVALKAQKKGSDLRKFYDHGRKLAKPTGLGYAGGLGPDTFLVYAKGNYKIHVTRDEAVLFREVWYDTYPEMKPHFDYFQRHQKDTENARIEVVDGQEVIRTQFWYATPLGAIRRGCSFTKGINGIALQSPGAELAKCGIMRAYRATIDPSLKSILYGVCRMLAFIHDENLSEIDYHDRQLAHAVAQEKARLMVEGGQMVVPDVLLKAEPCFMIRWNKSAEPRFCKNKLLAPWVPPVKKDEGPKDDRVPADLTAAFSGLLVPA